MGCRRGDRLGEQGRVAERAPVRRYTAVSAACSATAAQAAVWHRLQPASVAQGSGPAGGPPRRHARLPVRASAGSGRIDSGGAACGTHRVAAKWTRAPRSPTAGTLAAGQTGCGPQGGRVPPAVAVVRVAREARGVPPRAARRRGAVSAACARRPAQESVALFTAGRAKGPQCILAGARRAPPGRHDETVHPLIPAQSDRGDPERPHPAGADVSSDARRDGRRATPPVLAAPLPRAIRLADSRRRGRVTRPAAGAQASLRPPPREDCRACRARRRAPPGGPASRGSRPCPRRGTSPGRRAWRAP